jgi:hypothetical protein
MENCRMNKREFLGTALAAGALPGLADAAPVAAGGPVLLTISGDIRRPNRSTCWRWALYHIAVQA